MATDSHFELGDQRQTLTGKGGWKKLFILVELTHAAACELQTLIKPSVFFFCIVRNIISANFAGIL